MTDQGIRQAGFFMALAYATDLAIGHSRDFALRSCVLAMRLANAAGLNTADQRNVYDQALLRYIGCNADSHAMVELFGDEIAFRRDIVLRDMGNRAELAGVIARAVERTLGGSGAALTHAIEQALTESLPAGIPILAGHCEVARRIGERLGLSAAACDNLGQLYERWDGHGLPRGLQGEAVGVAVRIVTLAQDAVVLAEAHGFDTMHETVASRRGGVYDPQFCDLFVERAKPLIEGLAGASDHKAILALEPEPWRVMSDTELEEAFVALADMVDMRMPCTLGHSRAVADLCVAAGQGMGLPADDIGTLRLAGLAHDVGELSLPVAIWMKAGPLGTLETDTARLHPYHGERVLSALGESGTAVAALVSRHHERLDGSGYHRGIRGQGLGMAARLIAAAEAFQTARESRPHRAAIGATAAAARLRAMAKAGQLDGVAVEAVLAAAGVATRRPAADSLTRREIEVLRLIAGGKSVKVAAQSLGITPKTASNHIQNLYSKIGVQSRAAAALYAVERGHIGVEYSVA